MTKYSVAEVAENLRRMNYVVEADQLEADIDRDAKIILTALHGMGEARTVDEIGFKPLDVRVWGGDLLRDCYLVARIDGIEEQADAS